MPAYMLDTDISSYIMKRSNDAVLRKLQTVSVSDVCISAITRSELLYGVEISPRQQKDQAALDVFLRHVEVLDYPAEAALDYGRIRADLKLRGRPADRGSCPLFWTDAGYQQHAGIQARPGPQNRKLG
jgi:tRNA(fMet)-specific endonuclease VapC